MLTIFHLVWCALLWLLAHPHKLGVRRVAVIALVVGALPRVLIAVVRLQFAVLLTGWGFADLIAFEALTALWLVFLAMRAMGRDAAAGRLAFPMMVFAAVECVGTLAGAAGVMSGLVQGTLAGSWWRVTVALIYAVAQVWYLRGVARMNLPRELHWNRL